MGRGMAESLAQLQDALRDCYTLDRELGSRSMANTYRVSNLEQTGKQQRIELRG
jgi:hypothetical protein